MPKCPVPIDIGKILLKVIFDFVKKYGIQIVDKF